MHVACIRTCTYFSPADGNESRFVLTNQENKWKILHYSEFLSILLNSYHLCKASDVQGQKIQRKQGKKNDPKSNMKIQMFSRKYEKHEQRREFCKERFITKNKTDHFAQQKCNKMSSEKMNHSRDKEHFKAFPAQLKIRSPRLSYGITKHIVDNEKGTATGQVMSTKPKKENKMLEISLK